MWSCSPCACSFSTRGVCVFGAIRKPSSTSWTRLVGFPGGRGIFISEPSAGKTGRETHPVEKKASCEQRVQAWGDPSLTGSFLSNKCSPILTFVRGLGGGNVCYHPEELGLSHVQQSIM